MELQPVGLQELLDQQGGVVTRAQATERGVSARQLRGPDRLLVRLRHGVYADAGRVSTTNLSSLTGLRVASARLVAGVDLVAVGVTAALIHDVPLLGRPTERLQLAERKERRPRHHGSSGSRG